MTCDSYWIKGLCWCVQVAHVKDSNVLPAWHPHKVEMPSSAVDLRNF